MNAKYNGVIHSLKSNGRVWANDGLVVDCETVCGLKFSEMGISFHGYEIECECCVRAESENI
jgi:hypothetical protein